MDRLQKIIATRGYCSRRKAEELITQGLVKVDGVIVDSLGMQFEDTVTIEIKGYESKNANIELPRSYLFYKPKKVLSSASDDRGRTTVVDYFKDKNLRLYPIGRLDYETSGLLVVSNDGELANLMTHPSSHLNKTYEVKIPGFLKDEDIHALETGVIIDDNFLTSSATVELISRTHAHSKFYLTIHEGRNRQIRKMMEAISRRVIDLRRVRIGYLEIGEMKEGDYRQLSRADTEEIKNQCLKKRANNIEKRERK